MSTSVATKPKSKSSKTRRQRRPSQPGLNVTTGGTKTKSATKNGGKQQPRQSLRNTEFDGTGRLYECLSVIELNIRLRNLADHWTQSSQFDKKNQEKLLKDIAEIQNGVNNAFNDFRDQMTQQIRKNAKKAGDIAEANAKLTHQINDLENRLANAEKDKDDIEKQRDEITDKLQRENDTIKQQEKDKRANLKKQVKDANNDRKRLNGELNEAHKMLTQRDQELKKREDLAKNNENQRKDLRNQLAELQQQWDAREDLANHLKPVDSGLQQRNKFLEDQINKIKNELAYLKNETQAKDSTIGDLEQMNRAIEDDLTKKLEDYFKKFSGQARQVRLAQKSNEELKEFYQKALDQMRQIWVDASKEIKDQYESNYAKLRKELHGKLEAAELRSSEAENYRTQAENAMQNQLERLKNLEKENANLKNINEKNKKEWKQKSKQNTQLRNKIIDLETKISQYRVVWHHYMMLEGKLKNELGHLDTSMTNFEDSMGVEPPLPKRQRLAIRSIGEYGNGKYFCLELSEVPLPHIKPIFQNNDDDNNNNNNDEDIKDENPFEGRFCIVNKSFQTSVILKGIWHLINDRNEKVPLQRDLEIHPKGQICFSMLERTKQEGDILLDYDFITFTKKTDRLFLQDSTGKRIELFRPTNMIINKMLPDNIITTADRAEEAVQIGEVNFQGTNNRPHFTIFNVKNKPIILKDFVLRRQNENWAMAFPEVELQPNTSLRFLFSDKKQRINDILIDKNQFGDVDEHDELILEDSHGGKCTLYNYNKNVRHTNCSIM